MPVLNKHPNLEKRKTETLNTERQTLKYLRRLTNKLKENKAKNLTTERLRQNI